MHNRKFAKPAKAPPAWRKLSALQIERALCFKQGRTVAKDNTVSFEGTVCKSLRPLPVSFSRQQESRGNRDIRWCGENCLQDREDCGIRLKTSHTSVESGT